jgi:alpha-tubulin suppressor-like RCC1 family protein
MQEGRSTMQGIVIAWGDNSNGQLGDGSMTSRSTPGEVPNLNGVATVESGCGHVLALLGDRTVWGWGRNGFGQACGITTDCQTTPRQVPGLDDVAALAPGGGHSLVLRTDGTVWGWGAGFFGMLGDITMGVQPVPAQVPGIDGVVKLVAGGSHNLALRADGTVWSWGRDDHGQLGDRGDTDRAGRRTIEYRGQSFPCRTTPGQVTGLTGVTDIAAGGGHSLALLGDGTVLSWGYDDRGQLGVGGGTDRDVPTPVPGLTGIRSIAGGYHHTLAVAADGTVWACGLNDGGQCGDGTTEHRSTPVKVQHLNDVVSVAANGGGTDVSPGDGGHNVALLADGTAVAWGFNDFGQLGDGTTMGRLTPTEVKGLQDIRHVTAGGEVPQFRENPGGGYGLALQ